MILESPRRVNGRSALYAAPVQRATCPAAPGEASWEYPHARSILRSQAAAAHCSPVGRQCRKSRRSHRQQHREPGHASQVRARSRSGAALARSARSLRYRWPAPRSAGLAFGRPELACACRDRRADRTHCHRPPQEQPHHESGSRVHHQRGDHARHGLVALAACGCAPRSQGEPPASFYAPPRRSG